jgi:hypothetical protein
MAYTSTALHPRELVFSQTYVAPRSAAAARSTTEPRRGFFTRFLDALMAARMKQAEQEIARYIAATGGKFTDDTERVIERRFLGGTPSRW